MENVIEKLLTSKSEQMEREKVEINPMASFDIKYEIGFNAGISKAIEILKK